MFEDDTNLFFKHGDLWILFAIVNEELNKICEGLNANKLSLNAGKAKYSLLHKTNIAWSFTFASQVVEKW